jgi:hypothetical protein
VQEQRHASRQRVYKAGQIDLRGGAIDCTVRNLSALGAALDVASPIGIPEYFALIIPSDNLRKECKVMWRRETRLGVSFIT